MEANPLASRRAGLTELADQRGIDWKAELEGLPTDDDGLMVAALGGLLGLGIRRVFDTETPLHALEQQALRSEVENQVREQLLYRSASSGSRHADPRSEGGRHAR